MLNKHFIDFLAASHWDSSTLPHLFWITQFYQRGSNYCVSLFDARLKPIHFNEPKFTAVKQIAKRYSDKYNIQIQALDSLDLLLENCDHYLNQGTKVGFIVLSAVGHNVPFVIERVDGMLYLYYLDTLSYLGAKSATPDYDLMSSKTEKNFNLIDFYQFGHNLAERMVLSFTICLPYFAGESKGIRQADNYSCGIDAILLLKDFLRIKNPSINLTFCLPEVLHSIRGDLTVIPFKFPALLCKTTQRSIFLKDMEVNDSDVMYDSRLIDVPEAKRTRTFADFKQKHYQPLLYRKLTNRGSLINTEDYEKVTNQYLMKKGTLFHTLLDSESQERSDCVR
ncbi:hypothetical protein N9Q05_00870 [bacterium]|nr:hypothetical protein [bacterium]